MDIVTSIRNQEIDNDAVEILKKERVTRINMVYFMSDSDQKILLAVSFITTYVDGAMFILGTVGNPMNILVFCCLKTYRSLVTSSFLATTIFAGQIYLTCLCLSSMERYLMTSRSVWQRELMTLKRVRLLSGFWTVVWICVGIPHAIFTFDFALLNLCIPDSNFSTTLTYLNLAFSVVLPITILSVFGLLTWKNLGKIRLNALNSQVCRCFELIRYSLQLYQVIIDSSNILYFSSIYK